MVRFLLLFDSAWWNRGIAEEVPMASYGKAVTGTAVMARSAYEEKKIVAPLAGTQIPFSQHSYLRVIPLGTTSWCSPVGALALLLFVLQGSLLTQPLPYPSRWITGTFETTILPTLTLPKAKVKTKVNLLTKVKARAKKDKVKDQAKEKAFFFFLLHSRTSDKALSVIEV